MIESNSPLSLRPICLISGGVEGGEGGGAVRPLVVGLHPLDFIPSSVITLNHHLLIGCD